MSVGQSGGEAPASSPSAFWSWTSLPVPSKARVSVRHLGRHNTIPQPEGLKPQKRPSSQFWRLEARDQQAAQFGSW